MSGWRPTRCSRHALKKLDRSTGSAFLFPRTRRLAAEMHPVRHQWSPSGLTGPVHRSSLLVWPQAISALRGLGLLRHAKKGPGTERGEGPGPLVNRRARPKGHRLARLKRERAPEGETPSHLSAAVDAAAGCLLRPSGPSHCAALYGRGVGSRMFLLYGRGPGGAPPGPLCWAVPL
jgi:hypothetical protein